MRVIAGSARRMPLVTPKGNATRPTTDRIKETLFNIIQNDIQGCEFLDLFAGSGGIGIEALSRGAKNASFVESSKEAIACIRENLKKTHFSEKANLIPYDFKRALSALSANGKRFDIIFADPPYEAGYEEEILSGLVDGDLIGDDPLIILETALDREPDINDELEVIRIKEYKTNKHIFLGRKK